MKTTVVSHQNGTVRLQIDIDISGSMLAVEERIQDAVNDVGRAATGLALEQFDTDGSPVITGPIKWTRRCRNPKTYQTPYGGLSVERNVYQTSKGGKVFVPLEDKARIIRCATPRFARMLSSKYARLNASDVCDDLLNNHGREISRGTVQLITERVGSIAQAKEETWEYRTPVLGKAITHVVCSLDGAQVLTVNDGWREAMVGTISLVDCDGERQHTTYFGAAPEHGKATFLKRFERELERVKSQYPKAQYLGIADGAKDNWSFLKRHTDRQLLDFFHVTEYLAKVAWAAYPQKTGQPERQQWLHDRCHQLKHEPDAARDILTEMRAFKRKRKLSESVRGDVLSAIRYFENHLPLMKYWEHVQGNLPIGSGVTEAACKTLVKQRLCGSGMRWKDTGIQVVLSLRALVQTPSRWRQFWEKVEQYGVGSYS